MGIEYRDADSAATIANYERRAEAFWAATRDHDVTQNYTALLDAIAAPIGEGGGRRPPPFADYRGRFDGVFANASLFHVPTAELPRVLGEVKAALKPRGVLFASNPRGNNEEGMQDGRYCCFWDWPAWSRMLRAAGFAEVAHYYRPTGLPREKQPWLASVWRRG